MNDALKRAYNRRYSASRLDTQLFNFNESSLWEAVIKGADRNFMKSMEFGDQSHRLLLNYKYNTQLFAAFKTHAMQTDLVKALFDKDGNMRSFYKFRIEAEHILNNYNNNRIS